VSDKPLGTQPPDAADKPFGTQPAGAPVTRVDFERGLRAANMAVADLKDDLHRLAAQVVALTDELTRRLDSGGGPTVEAAVEAGTKPIFDKIQIASEEANSVNRLHLAVVRDKYATVQADPPPCMELLPICEGRCCKLRFPLSTQDLDEGVIRWDYGRPYMIRQRGDGYCAHNHPEQHGCTVYENRPAVCRIYHCRNDKRIWFDYEQRILATPENSPGTEPPGDIDMDDLTAAADARQVALAVESMALHTTFADKAAHPGVDLADARIDLPRENVRLIDADGRPVLPRDVAAARAAEAAAPVNGDDSQRPPG
jgi:Fe-S-cluster containining protein